MKKNRLPVIGVQKSTGNVYADLGYPDSGAIVIKAQLVAKISEIIQARNLTQSKAASKLGLTQPKISALLKGNFRGISERRLLDCLTRLGRDVQIVIRAIPKTRRIGELSVLCDDEKLLQRTRSASNPGTQEKIAWTRDELHVR